MTTPIDVLIVGAGSAGLSAGLMLARSRRTVVVLDGGAPRNAVAAHMHGVLGLDGTSPLDLVATGRAELARYGATVRPDRAESVQTDGDGFLARLASGDTIRARRLLVATGLRDELPAIPGLAERWGSGVAHCPYCDGWEARDARIAVVATGDGSIHQAQLLRQLSPHVTYFVEGTALAEHELAGLITRGIAVEPRRIARIESGEGVTGVLLDDGARIRADVVFVRPASAPHDELLRAFGAATRDAADGGSWVAVDPDGRTSVPGVWAAGNVVDPAATVPVAAAAGNTAGARINADLVADEIRRAIQSAS